MDRKKTIWIINQVAGHPESGWGERHYYMSTKWLENGYDVSIISGSFNHMFSKFPETTGQFTSEYYEKTRFCWVKSMKYDPKSVLRFLSMIIFAMKVLFVPTSKFGKPDVIVVSSMPIFPVFTGWILKKIYKAKLIFEIRDLWPLTPKYLMGLSDWHPMIILMSFLEKLGYRKSEHIVSVLPNSAKYINSISKAPEKFNYIPNGISEELLVKEKLPPEKAAMLPKDKFIIGYAGTMGMANALSYFIDAARLLQNEKNIIFALVGDGYLRPVLEEQAKDLDNVIFIERVQKNELQDLLSHFDICYIGRNDTPLFDHGVSSNKYFDYMLARKPVLVSSNKIKDPVELSGCGIIVKPESAKALSQGVMELYQMSDVDKKEMGEKGYDYVKVHHNFDILARKYMELFEN